MQRLQVLVVLSSGWSMQSNTSHDKRQSENVSLGWDLLHNYGSDYHAMPGTPTVGNKRIANEDPGE